MTRSALAQLPLVCARALAVRCTDVRLPTRRAQSLSHKAEVGEERVAALDSEAARRAQLRRSGTAANSLARSSGRVLTSPEGCSVDIGLGLVAREREGRKLQYIQRVDPVTRAVGVMQLTGSVEHVGENPQHDPGCDQPQWQAKRLRAVSAAAPRRDPPRGTDRRRERPSRPPSPQVLWPPSTAVGPSTKYHTMAPPPATIVAPSRII